MFDIAARELGIDPIAFRRRNLIAAAEMPYDYGRLVPYDTPVVYDSGDYPKMLELAKQLIGWDGWKKKQAEARKEGRWLGIGIGTTLDSGTNNFGQAQIMNPHLPFSGNSEVCNIRIDFDGSVIVTLGTGPSGQGHETTTAQVVADVLNIDPSMIKVRPGFDSTWNTFSDAMARSYRLDTNSVRQ